jgi:hypothetical protein
MRTNQATGESKMKHRFVVDYRATNKLIESRAYKMKIAEELFETISQKDRVITVAEAANFFWQIPINEDSQEIISFYLFEKIVFFSI